MSTLTTAEVLAFWREAGPERWFAADPVFDAAVMERLGAAHDAAAKGALDDWLENADGALALILLLDQAPRNMFRGTARAFATDAQALAAAKVSLDRGWDEKVEPALRSFFYLPSMHAEDLAEQDRCIALYRTMGNADGLRWAELHRDIIVRFGRFPHRNAVLGRDTTAEEQRFLDEGGFKG